MLNRKNGNTGRKPRAVIGLALALVIPAAPLPVIAQGSPGGAPTTQTLVYKDSDGPGQIEIQETGPGPSPKGRWIQVQISQNGADYQGLGFEWRTDLGSGEQAGAWTHSVIEFMIPTQSGRVFQFQGRLAVNQASGLTVGDGSYGFVGSAEEIDQWHIQSPTPPATATLTAMIETERGCGDQVQYKVGEPLNVYLRIDGANLVDVTIDVVLATGQVVPLFAGQMNGNVTLFGPLATISGTPGPRVLRVQAHAGDIVSNVAECHFTVVAPPPGPQG
jgi:hypothetical protein